MMTPIRTFITGLALITFLAGYAANAARPGSITNAVDTATRAAESQLRNLIEPLLDKYCHDECKLMSVNVAVDLATPDELAPGFDDVDPKSASSIAPSSGRVKILMDEKIGPISRGKLVELMQRYLDTVDYPVKIENIVTHFPQPLGSAAKVAELREKVTRQFKNTLEDLFRQFCPDHCMLADYQLTTDTVNPEEAQYGSGDFLEDSGVAIKVKNVSSTILIDDSLSPEEQANILEMARFKTNSFKNVTLTGKALKFPRPTSLARNGASGINGTGAAVFQGIRGPANDSKSSESLTSNNNSSSTNSNNQNNTNESKNLTESKNSSASNNSTSNASNETNNKSERFERFEKIERVENGDAVQAELHKFKVYGLIFGCSILSLLIFIAMASYHPRGNPFSSVQRVIQTLAADPASTLPSISQSSSENRSTGNEDRMATIGKRYEIERLKEELFAVFAQQPKVAKQVFSRILTEEGVETTAQYIHIFGESIVMDMLRDPSLQADINELMEFYAKNVFELDDSEQLDLLRKLHNRAIAGKLVVLGSRSSHQFDFLADMDGLQIMELVRNESLTVKAIIMTQCDPQKRGAIYAQLDEDARMRLLAELSRIDYLPRDYIFNVANALKRKRQDNPRLNTEALPGSEVLVNLLERTGAEMQNAVVQNLERINPDSARTVRNKLVSIDTLRHLRDGQLLEVVLSLKHDELLIFLKGSTPDVRLAIMNKSPKDLALELEEELIQVGAVSREGYQAVERKVLNRMKVMANEGLINLAETNERMFAAAGTNHADGAENSPSNHIKKASGW